MNGARPAMESCTMHSQPGKRRTETLDYIQSMLGQLRKMAETEDCDMLAYLIEMAYVEASDVVRGERPSRIAEQKRNRST
jgi:hypothetical protein